MSKSIQNMVRGAGRIFDLAGEYRERSHLREKAFAPKEADFHALRKDWEKIGGDIRVAMMKVEAIGKEQK